MIRRPPRPTRTDTLFPYTTLFRSVLKNIGFTDWAAVAANLLISIVGLAMTVVMALVVVDRYGRRRPLMWGALGMAASMAVLGGVFLSGETAGPAGYAAVAALVAFRSAARRVGNECVSTCRSRGAPYP